MDNSDVIIIGGGPAGSSCAWKLRQSGVDVIVLDKATFPRHKVCAGWITPPIVDELQLDLRDFQSQHTLQPISRFITGLIDGPEIETDYQSIVSYGIRRCEFDDYLLRRAGARLSLGESFKSLQRDGSVWIVNDRWRAPIVVGAAGHFCPIARWLSSAENHNESSIAMLEQSAANLIHTKSQLPVVLAQEVEFEMTEEQRAGCRIQPDRPELYFCPDLKGYGWVFRKGNFLNVGLGREGEQQLSLHVSNFVDFLNRRRKITFALPGRFQGHAYSLRTELCDPPVVPGVLLIGDAVGLADRQSGEGIRPAIESGLICAASILQTRSRPDESVNATYQNRLCRHFKGQSGFAATWIPQSLRQFAARRLMSSRWFNRRVLLDRWFLHRHQQTVRAL